MTDAMLISQVLLWLSVLALLAVVLALSRQIGILYERVAPMGALVLDHGPQVGDPAPVLELQALDGATVRIGQPAGRDTLLFFLSPGCPVCKKLLPIVRSLRRSEGDQLAVVLASDGVDRQPHEALQRSAAPELPYVLSAELGMRFHVAKLPYAVLLDSVGRVRAKGLVNTREQLESLLTARELGVASVQDYLERQSPALAKEAA